MRRRRQDLEARDIQVVVVAFEPCERARRYADHTEVPWPVLCDETRDMYRAYGMDRAPWWRVFGLSTLVAYARLLLRGRKRARSGAGDGDGGDDADVYQRGGDVLIDPDGVVRLHHVGRGPADRPSVSAVLRAAAGDAGD